MQQLASCSLKGSKTLPFLTFQKNGQDQLQRFTYIPMRNSFTEVNAHMQHKQEEKKTPRKPI